MKSLARIVFVGACAVIPGVAVVGCGQGGSAKVPSNAVKVKVTATDWKWTLDKTSFSVNQPIDFQVQADQGVHAFAISQTNIDQVVSQGDAPTDVSWTPTKAGTYTVYCDQYCGQGHENMHTTITVK